MKKSFLLSLFLLIIGIVIGLNVKTTTQVNIQKENRNLDQMVSESFSLGCEVGMAIYCDPKNLLECKKKCFTFLDKNPKVLEALKKKPEVTIEKMKREKSKGLFF